MAVKKVLAGCLVVVLVALVGAALAWWFILRPMWNAGVEGAKEWVSAIDLGDDIANQSPYDPPSDGRMTQAQVDAFIRVQKRIAADLGPDLARLARQAGDAANDRTSGATEPSLADLGNAFGELSGTMSKLRAAQAAGVNEVGLSREEYAWIRRQSLAAMSQLVAMPSAGDMAGMAGLPGLPGFAAPEDEAALEAARHNAALLRPHLPLLRETLGAMR